MSPIELKFSHHCNGDYCVKHVDLNPDKKLEFTILLDNTGLPQKAIYKKDHLGLNKTTEVNADEVVEHHSTISNSFIPNDNKRREKALAQLIRTVATYEDSLKACCQINHSECVKDLNAQGDAYMQKYKTHFEYIHRQQVQLTK